MQNSRATDPAISEREMENGMQTMQEKMGQEVQRHGEGPDETSAAPGIAVVSHEPESEGDGNPDEEILGPYDDLPPNPYGTLEELLASDVGRFVVDTNPTRSPGQHPAEVREILDSVWCRARRYQENYRAALRGFLDRKPWTKVQAGIPKSLADKCVTWGVEFTNGGHFGESYVLKTARDLRQGLREAKKNKARAKKSEARYQTAERKRVQDHLERHGVKSSGVALSAFPIVAAKDGLVKHLVGVDQMLRNSSGVPPVTSKWILENTNITSNEVRLLRQYLVANGLFFANGDERFWLALNHILSGPRIEAFSARAVEEAIKEAAMYHRTAPAHSREIRHERTAAMYMCLRVMRARRQQGELQIKMRALDLVASRSIPGANMTKHVLEQSQPKPKQLPAPKQKQLSEAARKQTP